LTGPIHVRKRRLLAATVLAFAIPHAALATPGDGVWVARYAGPVFADEAVAVGTAPDGSRVFVTGWSTSDPREFTSDIVTIAYDATNGAPLWIDRYGGSGAGWDVPNDLVVAPSGDTVYVVGGTRGASTGQDYVLIALDPESGERRWVFTYDGPSDRHSLDSGQGIAVAPDGTTVFVTGYSADGFTASGSYNTDYATIAIDAATGDEVWVSRHNGIGDGRDYAFEIGVAGGGDVVAVTGWNAGHGELSNDAATIGYDAVTGEVRWISRYDGPGGASDATYDLAVSPDGSRIYVAGESSSEGALLGAALLVAYDAITGEEAWAARYERPRRSTGASDVVVSPDGRTVFVSGGRRGRGSYPCYEGDYLTLAYEAATGSLRWSARYDGPAGCLDYTTAAFATADTVYVTGLSKASGAHQDVATVAYDAASGNELWVVRYDGPASRWDQGTDLVVGPGGDVFVTGYSIGRDSFRDFVTIRYDG
jgi:hypothetical protein